MSRLLQELARAGFSVESVDELRESGVRYVAAIPILLDELEREVDYRKKEWIVRALSVPWAKPAAIEPLMHEFRFRPLDGQPAAGTAWAIGNALWVLWDDTFFDEFVALASDRSYGKSREMLVLGFGKSKLRDRATTFLLTLLDDPDVDGHAVSALAKLGQPTARDALQEATTHPKTWVRNAAKRGIAKLDKAGTAQSADETNRRR